jgi:L-iditol 2-dehydrogenase
MEKMKAVVLRGVKDLRIEDSPTPKPADGEALVKIVVCGLCGTDVHMWAGTNQEGTFPFIPGHEWLGEVVEVDKGVKTLKVGDRVTGEPFIGCGVCDICRNGSGPAFCPDHLYYGFTEHTAGGLAEYHVSPEKRLYKVPESLNHETAALTEAVSVSYHAVWGVGGGAAPHDRIGIFGAGPIGLFAIMTCLVAAADVYVIEPVPFRQQMARDIGAEVILDPLKTDIVREIMDRTNGLGLTKIIECSGSTEATAMSVDLIAVDGTIVLTGQSVGQKVPIEIGKTIWKHANISGYAGCHYYFPKTLAFMAKGLADFQKVVTHRYSLDAALSAFTMGNQGTESGKIMIYPDPADCSETLEE